MNAGTPSTELRNRIQAMEAELQVRNWKLVFVGGGVVCPLQLARVFETQCLQTMNRVWVRAARQTHMKEQRSKTYEELVADKEAAIKTLQGRFDQLKDDFQYNLRLLEERDEELTRLDATVRARRHRDRVSY